VSPPLPLHGSPCAELTAAVVLLRSFFMNEYKIEGMTKWIKLLRKKGWDPAELEAGPYGDQFLKQVVL